MESQTSSDSKRLRTGIIIGIVLLILSAAATAMAIFMMGILIFGCTHSPPEWIYMIVFVGFPIPLIITSVVVPYLYIKRQRVILLIFTPLTGIFFSCLSYLTWFLILTQYC